MFARNETHRPPSRLSRPLALLLVIFTLVTDPAFGAEAPDSDGLLSGYTVTSWTDANGLRLGAIYAIAQDVDGYLWLGTDTGLLRFDGLEFSRSVLASHAQLPDERVSALYASSDGSVWAATSDGGGVYQIVRHELLRTDKVGQETQSVISLAGNSRGIVVAVTDTRVFRLREKRWEPLVKGLPETGILTAYFNREDQLFVGTTRGLFRNIEGTDAFESVAHWWSFAASQDSQGRLWTTDIRTGFRPVNDDLRLPPRGNGYRILHDREGHLWVATIGQGLWRVIDGGGSVSVQKVAGLLSDSVESLIEDREGNIWAGTTGGLHRLSRRSLTPVDVGFVVATEDTREGVWAATWLGLMRLYQRDGRWYGEPRSSADEFVRAVHKDAQGQLWIVSNQGLSRVTSRGLEPFPSPERTDTGLNAITSDKRGRVWVTSGRRIFRVSGTQLVPVDIRNGDHVGRITQLYGDRDGRLWVIANEGRRLGILDDHDTLQFRFEARAASGQTATIHSVFQDHKDVTWIAHSNGLTRFDESTRHTTVNSNNGLPGDRVWAVVDDDADGLWLSMDLGIVRFARKEFDEAVARRDHRIRYQLYDASDGLAGAPLRNVRAARAADGTLWFVRGGGLTVVDPRVVLERTVRPTGPVRIESVAMNEATMAPTPAASLPADAKRLAIGYTAVTLTSPTKVQFRYRLDGFDGDWIDAGSRREAVYTNLSPGQYTFRVEGVSIEGVWAESAALWAFTIAPRFYQTRTFYVVTGACLLLMVLMVWRLRLGLVRKQFALVLAERTRISQEVHDTLLQSLVGMSFQFDDLYNSVGGLDAQIRMRILRARQLIQAHIKEARHSIAELRSPVIEVQELGSALREFAARATAGTSTTVVFNTVGTPNGHPQALESQLLRIGKEAITNAIRHARARQIVVGLTLTADTMGLRISDDGCGFDLDGLTEVHSHYGLIMMRERVEQVGGTLTIASAPGQGTTVETSIPVPPRP